MTPFEHISVLISIVIGFAITTLLGGAIRLVHRRASVIWYWPSVLWMVSLLLIDIQVWWSRYSWRTLQVWTFSTFFAMMLVPIGVFALSALLVAEPDETPIDQRKEYFARRQVFFGLAAFTIAASYLPDLMTSGHWGRPLDAGIKGGWILLNLIGIATADERYHKALAIVSLATFCGYIALLFAAI